MNYDINKLPANYQLATRAMLVAIRFPMPSGRKTRGDLSKRAAKAEGIDDDDLSVVLRTIPDDVLAPLRAIARAANRTLDKKSSRWHGSTRLVSNKVAGDVLAKLDQHRIEYQAQVGLFLDSLDQYRIEAKAKLGDKYDDGDIPPRWVLVKRLSPSIVPALLTNPESLKAVSEDAARMAEEAQRQGTQRMIDSLMAQAVHMIEQTIKQTAPKDKKAGQRMRVSSTLLTELEASLDHLKVFLPDDHPALVRAETFMRLLTDIDVKDLKKPGFERSNLHNMAQRALDEFRAKADKPVVAEPVVAEPVVEPAKVTKAVKQSQVITVAPTTSKTEVQNATQALLAKLKARSHAST